MIISLSILIKIAYLIIYYGLFSLPDYDFERDCDCEYDCDWDSDGGNRRRDCGSSCN
jgi:hypothetical protein